MENKMEATITKIKSAEPMGSYQRTTVDDRKDAADFLLINVCPNVIRWNDGTVQRVTSRQLSKLQTSHSWATDF